MMIPSIVKKFYKSGDKFITAFFKTLLMVEEHKQSSQAVYSNRKKPNPQVPLFLNESVHNPLDVEEESCCSAHSTLVSDQNTTFTAVKLHGNVMTLKGTKLVDWPLTTEVACWYDTFPFTTTPIPLPHHYDEQKRAYVIYGNVCSVECGLAYMHREGRHHDLWERIIMFEDMMNAVFHTKIAGKQPAPPFLTLTRFGGFFSIEEYRASFQTVHLSVITPPFIMYPLIIQEKYKKMETSTATSAVVPEETVLSTGHVLRGLRRPVKVVESKPPVEPLPVAEPKSVGTGDLTVGALSFSSDEEDSVQPMDQDQADAPSVTVPSLNPVSAVQQDREYFSKLTKSGRGRGRGRGRGQKKLSPASSAQANSTMLTSFLVLNKK